MSVFVVDKNNNPYICSTPNFAANQSWGSVFTVASTVGLNDKTTVLQEEFAFMTQQITEREQEILIMVGQGYTSKEIAKRLNIKTNTVQVHRAHLMKKLDVPNSANLARWAIITELMSSA